MASSLSQYAVVGFFSQSDAQKAMQAAINQFKTRCVHSKDLSYCDDNIVYFHLDSPKEKKIVESFLLSQRGAQPKGCRCKFN